MRVPPALALHDVAFRYGDVDAVDGVTLEVAPGALLCLLGPSGCGKTTLLRLVGGHLAPARGRVCIHGDDVTATPPRSRKIGAVFQSSALFPHLSARENIAFGLRARGVRAAHIATRVDAQLSGGQQQRVAVARALVVDPALLVLDEPFASLDREVRLQLRAELIALQRRTGIATVVVTHDAEEALAMATHVGVMCRGKLLQLDTPDVVYTRPATPFVARALGDANLLRVTESRSHDVVAHGFSFLRHWALAAAAAGTSLLVRPEHVRIGSAAGAVRALVDDISYLGADRLLHLTLAPGAPMQLRARTRAAEVIGLQRGGVVDVNIRAEDVWAIPHIDAHVD